MLSPNFYMISMKNKEYKRSKGTVVIINVLTLMLRHDKKGDGAISSVDFQHIMSTVKGHLLTPFVRNNLIAVSGGGASGHKVCSVVLA